MTKKIRKSDNQVNSFKNIRNHLIVVLLKGVSLLPFWAIYTLSDFFYFLIRYIFKYRYKVIIENLNAAFPEKSSDEIAKIRDLFYRHFCDFSLESVKLYYMTDKEIKERIVFKGLEQAQKITANSKGSIVLAFHYNNWEWCSSIQAQFKYPILMVYNPPRYNKPMENFLKQSRGKWGGEIIPTSKAARSIFEYKQQEIPAVLWLAADQTALARSPFWITFLNREAAFFTGPERIAAKTNLPVLFQHIKKVARGKYEVEISLLIKEPAKLEPNEILSAYVQKMEEIIKEKPEYYLWSHRRWKHSRPANIPIIK